MHVSQELIILSNDELAFIVFGRWMGPMKGRTHTQSGSVRAYVRASFLSYVPRSAEKQCLANPTNLPKKKFY